jgi:hypothetical protein
MVCVDGCYITTIYADSPEQSEEMRVALIAERIGGGLREALRRLEDAGTCYNSRLFMGGVYGTLWVDKVNNIYYEYETDDMDLGVDDMTDEDLKDVIIGGL